MVVTVRVLPLCLLPFVLLGAHGAGAANQVDFLTGPSAAPPVEIALAHLRDAQLRGGIAPAQHARWRVRDQHRSERDGVTHLYLRQQIDGLPVWNRTLALAVLPDGRLTGLRVGWSTRPGRAPGVGRRGSARPTPSGAPPPALGSRAPTRST